ncbi:putative permease PerM homolog [Gammaproteobacteria bacterium]
MLKVLRGWFHRYFSDPQAVILAALLIIGFAVVLNLGKILAPVLAAIVVAYLLEGLVRPIEFIRVPRMVAVLLVFMLFMMGLFFLLFGLLPLFSRQLSQLAQQIPDMVTRGQQILLLLPERYPDLISPSQVKVVMDTMRTVLSDLGQEVLSLSLASIQGLILLILYFFLVPFLVFFFLKDKRIILGYIASLLPKERRLAAKVWEEMNEQIGNYVRGKLLEVLIVWSASYIAFATLDLNYAPLLSFLVGLSVIIPYVGAVVVTVPVVFIGYFEWGWGSDFLWVMVVYSIIQIIDGNIIVPLMFSEAVNLHPVAIMIAVLFFGGIWGFWGIFFAIPLATLVQVVITFWPRTPVMLEHHANGV